MCLGKVGWFAVCFKCIRISEFTVAYILRLRGPGRERKPEGQRAREPENQSPESKSERREQKRSVREGGWATTTDSER